MDLLENLSKSIYELIQKNNMTLQEFGDTLGYTSEDVNGILFEGVFLPPVEVERIANLFGMTMEDLLYYQERNKYVNLKELILRFTEIDEYYNHEPWSLNQILANINLLVPVEIER